MSTIHTVKASDHTLDVIEDALQFVALVGRIAVDEREAREVLAIVKGWRPEQTENEFEAEIAEAGSHGPFEDES